MKTRNLILPLLVLALPILGFAQSLNEDLIAAARKSNVEAVKELLAKGADPNAKTQYGATPLFFACDRGSLEIVRMLVERGADVNVTDTFYKSTAVGWAVSKNHAAIVKLLLERGAKSKESVMSSAIQEEKPDIVKAVLEIGGFKPEELTRFLTMAEKGKQVEIAEILKKAGAQPKPKIEYKVEPERLKLYEGKFQGDRFEVVIKIKDGKLGLSIGQEFESPLNPVGEHAFEVEQMGDAVITFSAQGNQVAGFNLKTSGREMAFKKVEAK